MKNLLYSLLLGVICVFLVTSCTKEDINDLPQDAATIESVDEAQERIFATPTKPDLVIRNIRSNLVVGSGPCPGPDKADGTCNSGATFVQIKATLRNRTPISIPASTDIIVKWEEFGQQPVYSILSGGLAGNSSKTIQSPVYQLTCPSGMPPYALVTRAFFAEADPNDAIDEHLENNNFSKRYNVCDDE